MEIGYDLLISSLLGVGVLWAILYAVYLIYLELTPYDMRQIDRMRLSDFIEKKFGRWTKKTKDSSLQQKLSQSGITKINAMQVQVTRYLFLLVILTYYLVDYYNKFGILNYTIVIAVILVWFITEPSYKHSVTNYVLNILVKRRQRKVTEEVFMLFDLIRSDLHNLDIMQDVNIYNIIKEIVPMCTYIRGTLSRMLSLWKTSPEKAKNVLYEEIGDDSTRILGDIIYRMDNVSKEEATDIITSEASTFSFSYYEKELQQEEKRKNILFGFFMLTCLVIMGWLLIFITAVFNFSISNNNIPM